MAKKKTKKKKKKEFVEIPDDEPVINVNESDMDRLRAAWRKPANEALRSLVTEEGALRPNVDAEAAYIMIEKAKKGYI